ncbi:MAG: hypothetical protein HY859_10935 [Caulobacterales bacterium]|nr:hypothetical protein [Caulobacterales bacterium]
MGARILSFLLGVMLSGLGWVIYDPKGPAGVKLPPIDLGLLEGHRLFIGLGALALGIVALLSAVLPKGDGPRARRQGPPAVDFDAVVEEPAEDYGHAHDEPHVHSTSGSPRPSALW